MRAFFAAIALFAATATSPAASPGATASDASNVAPVEVTFADHGKVVRTLPPESVRVLGPAHDVTVWEPHRDRFVAYRAVSLSKVLDTVYGARWRKAELLRVRCADGYSPAVPVAKVLAQRDWLAFGMTDGSAFHMKNEKQNEEADLGPFYLVWEDSPQVRADGGADWPYQIVGFDLVDFATEFPALAPPKTASDAARRGFFVFRRQCLSCHTINGEGGTKAPELNYPANVTEYWKRDWLKKWIDDPPKMRANTTMPGLDPDYPERARTLDDLVAYLESMKARKIAPKPKPSPSPTASP